MIFGGVTSKYLCEGTALENLIYILFSDPNRLQFPKFIL